MLKSLNMQEFKPTWITRKEMRNNPVKAITIFLPTAEVKKSDHFISYGEGSEKFDAKVSGNRQKMLRKISLSTVEYDDSVLHLSF